ncbi:8-amino-7-oxononanoate synthase [Vibrio mediterranei]|uniref:8-amino-7-oxononanoate synthase n=1 Tax=Vibrio mediterranei TaxID=689 RepID=UPI000784599E|nr:8-amino-7-oxononanoate synthase [Vibrio mediterranei]MCG9660573.1 8-amino-7-oxononanoate synthase [Vibrio mediterranei]
MTRAFNQRISDALMERERSNLLRSVQTLESGNQSVFHKDGQSFLNFSSNDYLGLASSSELKDSYQQAISELGVGSGASPLVTGYSTQHESLKSALTEWLGFDTALFFSSGYAANQALLLTLLTKGDLLLQDRLNHASLMEAGMLCGADMKRFRHNDLAHLESLARAERSTLAVTESVFSMDGDLSDIEAFVGICQTLGMLSMVDDAHGIGVIGDNGLGACGISELKPEILVVTFGKAFGLNGAAILCSEEMGQYLTQFARHYIYSTAFSAAHARALLKALSMIQTQHWRREKWMELSTMFEELLSDCPEYVSTSTPIKPWVVGDSARALALCSSLKEKGVWTTAIRPPTVPRESARLRITLSASHQQQDVLMLATHLTRFSEEG